MKKFLPYIVAGLISFALGYLYKRMDVKKDKPKETLTQAPSDLTNRSSKPESSIEVEFCKPKIIYKTKVVELPIAVKPKVGCNIDWEKEEVFAYAPVGYDVRCWVDYENKKYKELVRPRDGKRISRP